MLCALCSTHETTVALPLPVQESNEAFDVLESALQNHPYFRSQAAGAAAAVSAGSSPSAAGQQQQQCSPSAGLDVTPAASAAYTPVGAGSGSSTPRSATFDGELAAAAGDAASGSDSSGSGPLLVSMSAMLSAVRKDRISFMDKVAEAVQHATPETPTQQSAGEPAFTGRPRLGMLRWIADRSAGMSAQVAKLDASPSHMVAL